MENPMENYWNKRLDLVKDALEKNHFNVTVVKNAAEAKQFVMESWLPRSTVKSVAWGGSVTFVQTGLYEALTNHQGLEVLDTYDKSFSPEEGLERRRRALLTDLFVIGTNAVTEDGCLVNLDMIGNRVGAITFGPKQVLILVGRNKIAADLEDAMNRIKNYAAPVNTMRLDKKTPCATTSVCADCNSPDRICNTWVITEKCFPKGRITVVLINEDLGF